MSEAEEIETPGLTKLDTIPGIPERTDWKVAIGLWAVTGDMVEGAPGMARDAGCHGQCRVRDD